MREDSHVESGFSTGLEQDSSAQLPYSPGMFPEIFRRARSTSVSVLLTASAFAISAAPASPILLRLRSSCSDPVQSILRHGNTSLHWKNTEGWRTMYLLVSPYPECV